MKTGRALLVRPMEVPKRTGRTGNVHGAATVRMPARRANRRVSIGPPVNSRTGPEPRNHLGSFDSLLRVTTPIHYAARRHVFVSGSCGASFERCRANRKASELA